MKKIREMHTNELKLRIGVLTAVRNSLNLSGRFMDEVDARRLADYKEELKKREVNA